MDTQGGGPGDGPLMYDELADWFHLLTSPAEYAEEAGHILRLLREAVDGPLGVLLELGSGGGNTASHLRRDLRCTLTDISPAMLDLSRRLNPECEHILGDMRTLRLERSFDAVLVHDAIMYMTTENDLRAAMGTAFAHLRPGGAAVFAPDCVVETFRPRTEHGGHDAADRGLRYLEWDHDPDPGDTWYVSDFAMLLREGGATRVRYDRHQMGLFPRETWLAALRDAGFVGAAHADPSGRDIFVGVRPAAPGR